MRGMGGEPSGCVLYHTVGQGRFKSEEADGGRGNIGGQSSSGLPTGPLRPTVEPSKARLSDHLLT